MVRLVVVVVMTSEYTSCKLSLKHSMHNSSNSCQHPGLYFYLVILNLQSHCIHVAPIKIITVIFLLSLSLTLLIDSEDNTDRKQLNEAFLLSTTLATSESAYASARQRTALLEFHVSAFGQSARLSNSKASPGPAELVDRF